MLDEKYEKSNAVNVGQKISYDYNEMKSALSQILAVLIGNIIMLQFGMVIAMQTVVNNELYSKEIFSDQKFTLNSEQASWYGSLVLIFLPVGGLLSSAIQDKFGRKACLTLVSIPEFLGWLFLYLANSSILLYLSSICLGISMGLSEAPILTYIGESVETRLRSSLSSFTVFCSMIGLSATFNLASLFPWRQIVLMYLFLPVAVFLMTSLIIPESPMWLLSKNKIQEATKSLCWLRGFTNENAVHTELYYMQEFAQHKNGSEVMNPKKTNEKNENECILRTFIKFSVVFVICNISAMFPVKPFLGTIMEDIGLPSSLHSKFALAIVGTGTLCGTLLNMFTVKFIGKKKLLIISIFVSCSCQLALSACAMDVFKQFVENYWISWLSFILFCCISFTAGYGIAPIPWILLGELFPMKSRGVLSGIASAVSSVLAFLLTKTYFDLKNLCTLPGTMMIYSFIGLVGIPYIYYKLPETENKTLQQIQDDLEKN